VSDSEAIVLGMWEDYAAVGLPGRANEAYIAMHRAEDQG
jgi:hypothetical protein